jgi:hypothetical protein
MIVLYTSSLFPSDSCDFRLMIQYSLRSLRSSCFFFVNMCLCQISFRSRCIPRYFTSSGWVSCLLFVWTGVHVFFFKVKVTWADFVSFTFISHFFNHSWILFRLVCIMCVTIVGSSCVVSTTVSSAKLAVVLSVRTALVTECSVYLSWPWIQFCPIGSLLPPEYSVTEASIRNTTKETSCTSCRSNAERNFNFFTLWAPWNPMTGANLKLHLWII